MMKSVVLWIIAITLTLASVVYQRYTGPTHPATGKVVVNEQTINYSLLRSHNTTTDAEIKIKVPDENVTGQIKFRRFKSHDDWTLAAMNREGDHLSFFIPKQPMAGKVTYEILLTGTDGVAHVLPDEPVVMRFKDPVPPYILWPHVFFMLIWMFASTRTGLQALVRGKSQFNYTLVTTILLACGGLILGPLVQKFAFDAYWTGWPFGTDLTDNKVAVSALFWLIAVVIARRKGKGRGWVLAAAVTSLVIWIIPHSMQGSELDYTKLEPAPAATQPAVPG